MQEFLQQKASRGVCANYGLTIFMDVIPAVNLMLKEGP